MVDAFNYYWFHLVPQLVLEQSEWSPPLNEVHKFPKVAMEQCCYVHFALPFFSGVVPVRGDWSEVPMGQDVLLDSRSSRGLRSACEAMIARLPFDPTACKALLPALQTLLSFSARLHQGHLNILVAHWPERVMVDSTFG